MRTPEQMRAIQARGKDLLVSAAAGAGKTTVLIDRILSLIEEDQIEVSQMLIVTFTHEAAKVMRERLWRALEDRAAQSEGEHAAYLARQLDALSQADICTLHTFCQKFLRRHFAAAGVPADFRLGDEQTMQSIRARAAQELLEEEYTAKDPDFLLLTRLYSRVSGDDALIELLFDVYEASRCQSDPRQFLYDALRLFDTWSPEDASHPWNRILLDALAREYESAMEQFVDARDIASCTEAALDCCATLTSDIDAVWARQDALISDPLQLAETIDEHRFTSWPRGKKMTEAQKEERASVKALRDAARKRVNDADKRAQELLGGEAEETLRQTQTIVRQIVRLVTLLDAKMHDLMLQENTLDFSSLEHCTIQALEAGAAQAAREQYRAIFFDEYQDANRVQERIVSLLAQPNDRFFVGDVKQSIYRFRSADPQLFLEKHAVWGAGRGGERIDLNKNFRSMQSVLDAVNSVFSRIMHASSYSVEYDETQALYFGSDAQRGGARVQLHVLQDRASQSDDQVQNEDELNMLRADEIEARYVAALVSDLLETGTLTDRQTGESRPIEKSDIAILLRSTKNSAESISYALERAGIDCVAQMSSRHFDTVEVRALLDLICVLDNPYQDVPLIGALRSPLFLFALDDLARIRLCVSRAPLFEAMERYAQTGTDDAAQRCRQALSRMQQWRVLSRVMPLAELIERILADTGYEDLLAASAIGAQKLANIRLLLSRVRTLQEGSFDGIAEFLAYVKRAREGKDSEEAARSMDARGAVQIMSIHKSKGLEFPVVIVPMLGRKFHQNNAENVFIDNAAGIAVKYINPVTRKRAHTLASYACMHTDSVQSLQEEMRILYVAMTRACDRLIMTGMTREAADALRARRGDARFMLDWVLPAAMAENEKRSAQGCEKLWEICFTNGLRGESDEEAAAGASCEITQSAPFDAQTFAALEPIFSWEYPYQEETRTLSKTTVTALKLYGDSLDQEQTQQVTLPLPKNPQMYGSSRGMRRGTATHLAVQHLDFCDADTLAQVTRQIDRMVQSETLLAADRALIDDRGVLALCQSDLGRRMAHAQSKGRLYRETPFTFAPEGDGAMTLVQGAIDAWFSEEDGLVLVDYKTDAVSEGGAASLVQHYARQLQWYCRALEKLSAQRVKLVCLYSFSCAQWASLDDVQALSAPQNDEKMDTI